MYDGGFHVYVYPVIQLYNLEAAHPIPVAPATTPAPIMTTGAAAVAAMVVPAMAALVAKPPAVPPAMTPPAVTICFPRSLRPGPCTRCVLLYKVVIIML